MQRDPPSSAIRRELAVAAQGVSAVGIGVSSLAEGVLGVVFRVTAVIRHPAMSRGPVCPLAISRHEISILSRIDHGFRSENDARGRVVISVQLVL